jgi:hypothetical protein
MTFLAWNFSRHDVPAMGKIGVVGNSMHLYPWNSFLLAYIADQLFFFLAVRHRFFMAIPAKIDIGDGSLLMGRDPRMAVKTSQPCIFYMFFVIILYRLGVTGIVRTRI